ncbi:MAG: Re/Si-specific NAD(P)(+) transhydrogenase subunit alpha [SAR324 cluster bacterium]|nr:Re/Si-specific NAD(P)(+) transhydrogenase subunit alpha [SAR324 cluster bacterium]
MIIGVPREVQAEERRVALVPDIVGKLKGLGFEVLVEVGAGAAASFPDELYREAGAELVDDPSAIWERSDWIVKVREPLRHPKLRKQETGLLREGQILTALLAPGQNPDLLKKLARQKVTALALEAVPRITRAQSMDVLSSMANISGYRAVIEGAHHFGRFFTGQITAAGKIPPAKVLVIGAGVAGLSAIGTAQHLGAIVRAFDTRPAVKDEVHSMGAEFLELNLAEDGTGAGGYAKEMSAEFIKAEMALFAEQAKEVDLIITTAAIPGKTAPTLITEAMVQSMKPGSVIVDLAAASGGNCELTEAGKVTEAHGVTIVGRTDWPSQLATQASQLFSNNLLKLIKHLGGAEDFKLDLEDEITRAVTVAHDGEILWPPPAPTHPAPKAESKPTEPKAAPSTPVAPQAAAPGLFNGKVLIGFAIVLATLVGFGGSSAFLSHLTVFVLACFVGYMVIWNVTPALHTPLMSVTNAISGIIVIGGMVHLGGSHPWLAALAVLIATVNIVGGFLVTHRMLGMFRK